MWNSNCLAFFESLELRSVFKKLTHTHLSSKGWKTICLTLWLLNTTYVDFIYFTLSKSASDLGQRRNLTADMIWKYDLVRNYCNSIWKYITQTMADVYINHFCSWSSKTISMLGHNIFISFRNRSFIGQWEDVGEVEWYARCLI